MYPNRGISTVQYPHTCVNIKFRFYKYSACLAYLHLVLKYSRRKEFVLFKIFLCYSFLVLIKNYKYSIHIHLIQTGCVFLNRLPTLSKVKEAYYKTVKCASRIFSALRNLFTIGVVTTKVRRDYRSQHVVRNFVIIF